MMGWLKSIFTPSTIVSGIDKMVYTDEERADTQATLLKLYEPFKLAQRYLAVMFGSTYCLGWFITLMISFVTDVTEQMAYLTSGDMGNIVLAIVGFYFFGGAAEGAVNSFRKAKEK